MIKKIYFSLILTKPIIVIIVINKVGKKTETVGGIFPVLPSEINKKFKYIKSLEKDFIL